MTRPRRTPAIRSWRAWTRRGAALDRGAQTTPAGTVYRLDLHMQGAGRDRVLRRLERGEPLGRCHDGRAASLRDAVAGLVRDGDVVAMEGFTHLIPTPPGTRRSARAGKELTLVRMTPDLIYDQLIGMGCARKLVFSWGSNPGVGSAAPLPDAVEQGWPQPLEIEEHSHAGLANAYVAGAAGLPFASPARLRRLGSAQTQRPHPVHCVPVHRRAPRSVPSIRPTARSSMRKRPTARATS